MILFEVSANCSHRLNGLQRRAQSLRPMLLAFEWLVGRDPALRRPLKRAGSVKRSRSTAECPCTKVRFAGTFRVRLEGPFFSSAQMDLRGLPVGAPDDAIKLHGFCVKPVLHC